MSQRYNGDTKRPKPKEIQLGILKIYAFCWKIQQRALGPGESCCKVSVEATCWHFKPWHILKETTELAGPLETMPQEPWHPGKGARLDHIIQLNCGEVCTHVSYKRTRAWENLLRKEQKQSSFKTNYD